MGSLGLNGNGVSRGIAIGKAYLLQRDQLNIVEYQVPVDQVEDEVVRFIKAVAIANEQLTAIREKIPTTAPMDIASFIDTHVLMLSDKALSQEPIKLIRAQNCNAEWALKKQRDGLVAIFEEMDDAYLRTRKDDVDHVVNRIQRILLKQKDHEHVSTPGRLKGRVIIADDLSPADTVTMQHEGIVAFVTEYGGPTSHTTILARSLGIPAVVGVRNVLRYLRQDEELIVDGFHGAVIASPDKVGVGRYHKLRKEERRNDAALRKLKDQPAVSRDGLAVSLQANVEIAEDMAAMKRVAAKGVGLYRTEYLFLNRQELPDEDEQYVAYRKLVRSLRGSPLTIRTLDLGADKALPQDRRIASRGSVAMNPALGLRAIRLCLRDVSLFMPQIRAMLRVSAEGPVNIMIPMLSCLEELNQTMALIELAKQQLLQENKLFDDGVAIGGMIEVPAAALSADVFARHLDFLSIGTNDLIQYSMAADRLDNTIDYLYQPMHPSILRLIVMTIKAGKKAGIPVAMCGEMAGESRYTRLLLGLGLRQFSMQPTLVPEVKRIIQDSDVEVLSKKIQHITRLASSTEIEAFVDRLNAEE